jgi:hypothetical protein
MIKMMLNVSLPDNYDIIFSDSGKQKNLINEREHRHTKIFTNSSDLNNAGYVNASVVDLYATRWFSDTNKVGLVFH